MRCDVVIVEDDEDLGQMVEFMLTPLELTTMRYTDAGRFLFDVDQGLQCRLVVMDMLLSGGDGREVCSELRNQNRTNHWLVLLMSAHPDAENSCLNAGANGFMSKPFDLQQFRKRVLDLLASVAITAA